MPNWCYTSLSVTGSAARVAEFVEFAKSKTNDSVLSFENFVPMPPTLQTNAGSDGDIGFAAFHSETEWQVYLSYPWAKGHNIHDRKSLQDYVERHRPEAKAQGKIYADNLAQHGAKHWYDWSITHWGTKWDACRPTLEHHEGGVAVINFETAWSPATPVILAMSVKFPDLTFEASFDEEAGFFKFEATWESGAQTSQVDLPTD